MRTIAISIDEPTLETINGMARKSRGRASGGRRVSRSEIVRRALVAYIAAQQRQAREESERGVFAKHRDRLRRQARALVLDQALP